MSTNLFQAFVQEPTLQRYRRLRNQVMRSTEYDPCGGLLGELQTQLDLGDWRQVLRQAEAMEVPYRLSPRYYYLVGQAALAEGNMEKVDMLRKASRACMAAILDSGDGTRNAPHIVTYLTDQYDVAMACGLQVRCQHVVRGDKRAFDVLTTHDGLELWFDITDLLPAVAAHLVYSEPSNV